MKRSIRFHGRRVVARYRESKDRVGTCSCCGAETRRSSVTSILHEDCYWCRRLKMVYGPNIKVKRPLDRKHERH